ncbi:unnamed protein product [marine sediment metagenome]|uniref:Uncharacterized protein n=1 Tax=marine sediment metagenome TaxID=412755 RepID=X1DBP9_9ZZZZ
MSNTGFNQFKGDVNTERIKYIADPQLRNIVNVSIALARPLIVKGEPGTGKILILNNSDTYLIGFIVRANIPI